jgi:hypothetical protein
MAARRGTRRRPREPRDLPQLLAAHAHERGHRQSPRRAEAALEVAQFGQAIAVGLVRDKRFKPPNFGERMARAVSGGWSWARVLAREAQRGQISALTAQTRSMSSCQVWGRDGLRVSRGSDESACRGRGSPQRDAAGGRAVRAGWSLRLARCGDDHRAAGGRGCGNAVIADEVSPGRRDEDGKSLDQLARREHEGGGSVSPDDDDRRVRGASTHEAENLRVLCAEHHRRAAELAFGPLPG